MNIDDPESCLSASLLKKKSRLPGVAAAQSCEIQLEFEGENRALSAERNEHSPIIKLPTELLLTVFKYLVWDPPDCLDQFLWSSINHVCRVWRSLALDAPSLWQKIVLPAYATLSFPLFSEMVRLSRDLPLTVIQHFNWEDTGRTKNVRMVRLALQQAPRLEILQVELSSGDFESCGDLLLQPFPLLRSFCLCGDSLWSLDPDGLWHCPENIFGKHAPLLRAMELYHCLPSSISPVMPYLTSLFILFEEFFGNCIDQLLAGLQNVPMLETLEINVRCPARDTHDILSQDLNNAYLSNLRQLTFIGDIESSRILKFIACPNVTTFAVRDGIFQEIIPESCMEGILHVTKFIGSRFSFAKSLSFHPKPSFKAQGWNIDLHVEPQSDVNPHVLSLELGCWKYNEAVASLDSTKRVALPIFDALSLSGLHTLELFGISDLSIEHWERLFARMPGLERIEVDSSAALLQVLADFENDRIFPPPNVCIHGDPEVRARVPFPDLRYLQLVRWEFAGRFWQDSADLWTSRLGERLSWVKSPANWYEGNFEAGFHPLDIWDPKPNGADRVDTAPCERGASAIRFVVPEPEFGARI